MTIYILYIIYDVIRTEIEITIEITIRKSQIGIEKIQIVIENKE